MQQLDSQYQSVVFTDRSGFERLSTRILTIEDDAPVLMEFSEFTDRFTVNSDDDKATEIAKRLDMDTLVDKCPKIYPYQTVHQFDNRTMTRAKMHACTHRAIWIRNPGKIEFKDFFYDRYITEKDLEMYPDLKKLLADPSTQYSDQKSACDGLVTLATIDMQTTLGWTDAFVKTLDADKLSNRMSIMARLDAVNWTDVPDELNIICMPEEACESYFGYVPADGIILANPTALNSLKFETRKGDSTNVTEGTKIRGGANMPPIKGTLQLIPDSGVMVPTLYVIEGGSLKASIDDIEEIIITSKQLLSDDAPFYVETPSRERLIRNPRFGQHMVNLVVAQTKEVDPEYAASLVPQISDMTRLIAEYRAPLIEYVHLCTYPQKGYGEQPRSILEPILQMAIDGDITILDIKLEGDETVEELFEPNGHIWFNFGKAMYQTFDMEEPLVFGLTSAGKRLIRGGSKVLLSKTTRDDLDKHITKMIRNDLSRRVRGCGGMAQGNHRLSYCEAVISQEMADQLIQNTPKGDMDCWHLTEDGEWKFDTIDSREQARELLRQGKYPVAMMYWPSKFAHCLMGMRVRVDMRIQDASIQVHPDILDSLGGDSDGDLIYMIIDPAIVRCIPDVTKPLTVKDTLSGKVHKYKNVMHMTKTERDNAQSQIDQANAFLSKSSDKSDAYVRFSRICASTTDIGKAFVARDMMADVTKWNLRVYTRMGQICQEALAGLKMKSGGDVVKWFLDSPSHLSQFLGIPQNHLPFINGAPWWDGGRIKREAENGTDVSKIVRYRDMYKTMCTDASMQRYLEHAPNANTNAHSVYEWMLARTRIGSIDQIPYLRKGDIRKMIDALNVDPKDLRHAKYHLRMVSAGSFDMDGLWYADKSGGIQPAWNRWMRAEMLRNTGVPIHAIKKVILEYMMKYPSTVENLGLMDLLDVVTAEVPEIIAEINNITETPVVRTLADVLMDYAFGTYESLEEAASVNNVNLEDLEALRMPR
jgi:hypothetical protein